MIVEIVPDGVRVGDGVGHDVRVGRP